MEFCNTPFLQHSTFPTKKPRRIEPAGLGNFKCDQRFENWKRLRAPGWPYFLRSFMRESRVSRPSAFSAPRRFASNFSNAPGDAVPHRAGLAVRPAAADVDARVEFFRRAGDGQRLRRGYALCFQREIIFKLAAVDGDFTVAGREPDPRDGGLAPSRAEIFGDFGFSHLSVEG